MNRSALIPLGVTLGACGFVALLAYGLSKTGRVETAEELADRLVRQSMERGGRPLGAFDSQFRPLR